MDLGLSGRHALVTAASKGLGRACAQALAEEGAQVFISSRDEDSVRATAEAIGAKAHRPADMSQSAQIAPLVAAAVAALGGLDILVCNAGGPPPGTFESTEVEAWATGHELTLMSTVRLIKAALPHLKQSGQGRIVIITSISVRQPIGNLLLSNAYRAAVTGMAKTLSTEVGRQGVTVNMLAPDGVLTDRVRSIQADLAQRTGRSIDELKEEYVNAVPLGRYGDPSEFGAACAFLCSRQAGYITGQTLGVDGGKLQGVH
jgi:3-oxoacyl-[acyl-carrier protein] reductase